MPASADDEYYTSIRERLGGAAHAIREKISPSHEEVPTTVVSSPAEARTLASGESPEVQRANAEARAEAVRTGRPATVYVSLTQRVTAIPAGQRRRGETLEETQRRLEYEQYRKEHPKPGSRPSTEEPSTDNSVFNAGLLLGLTSGQRKRREYAPGVHPTSKSEFSQMAAEMPTWEQFREQAKEGLPPDASENDVNKVAKKIRRDWVRQKERDVRQRGFVEQRLRGAHKTGVEGAQPKPLKSPLGTPLSISGLMGFGKLSTAGVSAKPKVAFSMKGIGSSKPGVAYTMRPTRNAPVGVAYAGKPVVGRQYSRFMDVRRTQRPGVSPIFRVGNRRMEAGPKRGDIIHHIPAKQIKERPYIAGSNPDMQRLMRRPSVAWSYAPRRQTAGQPKRTRQQRLRAYWGF